MLDFFLFQAICKAADHVTKNDLYPGKIMNHDQFESMTDLWRRVYRAVILGILKKTLKILEIISLFISLFFANFRWGI